MRVRDGESTIWRAEGLLEGAPIYRWEKDKGRHGGGVSKNPSQNKTGITSAVTLVVIREEGGRKGDLCTYVLG